MRAISTFRKFAPSLFIGTFLGAGFECRRESAEDVLHAIASETSSLLNCVSQSIKFNIHAAAAESLPVVAGQSSLEPFQSKPSEPKTSAAAYLSQVGLPTLENFRDFGDFILSYDTRTRIPRWVFESLDRNSVSGQIDRTKFDFFEDVNVHEYFRATSADYRKTGYQRGHMAAAANHRSDQTVYGQTFVLSNIAPQIGDLNCGIWNALENFVRHTARDSNVRRVHVFSGPLFLPVIAEDHSSNSSSSATGVQGERQIASTAGRPRLRVTYEVIGDHHVAVPTHFFKAVLVEGEKGELDAYCFVMPNDSAALLKALGHPTEPNMKFPKADLARFFVPLDVVERAAGFLLFSKVKSRIRCLNGAPYRPQVFR